MFVCCAGDHPAPRQYGHQHQLGPVFPSLYEPFRGGVEMIRMQRGVGKVFVRGLMAIFKQMTRNISYCHDISPCSMYLSLVVFLNFYINEHNIRRRHLCNIHKIPFVLITLPFQIVDYIGEI